MVTSKTIKSLQFFSYKRVIWIFSFNSNRLRSMEPIFNFAITICLYLDFGGEIKKMGPQNEKNQGN